MTKKLCYSLTMIFALLMSGCSTSSVNIEKVTPENSEIHQSMMDENKGHGVVPSIDDVINQIESQEDMKNGPVVLEVGDRFPTSNDAFINVDDYDDYGIDSLGEIYATITDVRVYQSFDEAGINPEGPFLHTPSVIYEPQKYTMGENYFIVTIDFTVENVNATSSFHYDEPEKYDEYDFRIGFNGGCGSDTIWWTGLDGSLKTDKCADHPEVFHLEPGETVSFSVSYGIDLLWNKIGEDWYGLFCVTGTPENGIAVDLHLEDKLSELSE